MSASHGGRYSFSTSGIWVGALALVSLWPGGRIQPQLLGRQGAINEIVAQSKVACGKNTGPQDLKPGRSDAVTNSTSEDAIADAKDALVEHSCDNCDTGDPCDSETTFVWNGSTVVAEQFDGEEETQWQAWVDVKPGATYNLICHPCPVAEDE